MKKICILLIIMSSNVTFASQLDGGRCSSMEFYDKNVDIADPRIRYDAPIGHERWKDFIVREGEGWYSIWDIDKGIPIRIFGSGIDAPRAVDSESDAISHARTILERYIDLLSPGARSEDFQTSSSIRTGHIRTVVFQQKYKNITVLGGALMFVFKKDRLISMGATTFPSIKETKYSTEMRETDKGAVAWIEHDYGPSQLTAHEGPFILPILSSTHEFRYYIVDIEHIYPEALQGGFRVYVDAASGFPIARERTVLFGTGRIFYGTPRRWPGGDYVEIPASRTDVLLNGESQYTDELGYLSWSNQKVSDISSYTHGVAADVVNLAGTPAILHSSIENGDELLWIAWDDQYIDAQITTYVHLGIAKEHARTLNPNLVWLDASIIAYVNNDTTICNAYYDLIDDSLTFFTGGSNGILECANTGRLPDVIYHEFGHALHVHSIPSLQQFNTPFSEGAADYFAASITGDPAFATGFFNTTDSLRHLDPPDSEPSWPDDVGSSPHDTGLIFSSAMWDLRKSLIEKMGSDVGGHYANRLFYGAVQRATHVTTTYTEILVEDDDDGNLANGTPNECLITEAFVKHGLALKMDTIAPQPSINVSQSDEHIWFELAVLGCPSIEIAEAILEWKLRGSSIGGTQLLIREDSIYLGRLPIENEPAVVQYSISITYNDGTSVRLPKNQGDPMYEYFIGDFVNIYCTSFEENPFAQGWSQQTLLGTAAWSWDGPGSLGPPRAWSGSYIVGVNAAEHAPSSAYMESPPIDISGFGSVRLQYYRWLSLGGQGVASVSLNGNTVWSAPPDDTGLFRDYEWRFNDIDITDMITDRTIRVSYQLYSVDDEAWGVEDFCIVGTEPNFCGDGSVMGEEECDRGDENSNLVPDACRENCRKAYCGDGVLDSFEQCDDGNATDDDGCSLDCLESPTFGLAGGGCNIQNREGNWNVICILLLMFLFLVRGERRATHAALAAEIRQRYGSG